MRLLQNLSADLVFRSGISSSVVRLHCDARDGDFWGRGVPLLAVLQPAGLRAVGPQCQRGGAHLQLPLSVRQLHADGTEDVDRLVRPPLMKAKHKITPVI